MDIRIRAISGCEAAKVIRHPAPADTITVPFAAMTVRTFAEDVRKAAKAGVNAHAAKPIDMPPCGAFRRG